MLTVFETDLGTHQGRIPSAHTAGAFVLELGHAARLIAQLETDSAHEVSQAITLAVDTKLLRARVHIRAPQTPVGTLPGDGWWFTVRLDDVEFYRRKIHGNGQDLTLNDIAVSALAPDTTRTLTFRLHFSQFGGA